MLKAHMLPKLKKVCGQGALTAEKSCHQLRSGNFRVKRARYCSKIALKSSRNSRDIAVANT